MLLSSLVILLTFLFRRPFMNPMPSSPALAVVTPWAMMRARAFLVPNKPRTPTFHLRARKVPNSMLLKPRTNPNLPAVKDLSRTILPLSRTITLTHIPRTNTTARRTALAMSLNPSSSTQRCSNPDLLDQDRPRIPRRSSQRGMSASACSHRRTHTTKGCTNRQVMTTTSLILTIHNINTSIRIALACPKAPLVWAPASMASSCMGREDKVACRASWGLVDNLRQVVQVPRRMPDRAALPHPRRLTSRTLRRMSLQVQAVGHLFNKAAKVKVNPRVKTKALQVKVDHKGRASMVETGLALV